MVTGEYLTWQWMPGKNLRDILQKLQNGCKWLPYVLACPSKSAVSPIVFKSPPCSQHHIFHSQIGGMERLPVKKTLKFPHTKTMISRFTTWALQYVKWRFFAQCVTPLPRYEYVEGATRRFDEVAIYFGQRK